jgi:hypothetical protein
MKYTHCDFPGCTEQVSDDFIPSNWVMIEYRQDHYKEAAKYEKHLCPNHRAQFFEFFKPGSFQNPAPAPDVMCSICKSRRAWHGSEFCLFCVDTDGNQRYDLGRKILVAIAGAHTTPVEGYGTNIDWAVTDAVSCIAKLRSDVSLLSEQRDKLLLTAPKPLLKDIQASA